jgi:hypothetical protein
VCALTPQRLELLAVANQELQGDRRVSGIVLGAAWRERAAVLRECAGVDGEDDEHVVLEECRDDRAVGQLEAHGDATARETLAQLLGPVLDGPGAVLDDGEFDGICAGDLQADVVLPVGPVDADECGELGWIFLHGDLLD